MNIWREKYLPDREKFKKETWAWLETILGVIPGKTGNFFRGFLYGLLFPTFRGKKTSIGQLTHIWFPWNIFIGSYSHIGKGTHLSCLQYGDLIIGSYVMISPYCMVTASGHSFDSIDTPMVTQGMFSNKRL